MPSSKQYLEYVLEQLSDLDEISYRAMMGEYIIYYRAKIVGGIYDDRFLVKPVKSAMSMMSDASMELPYDGAKEMILVDDLENKAFLNELFEKMYDELSYSIIRFQLGLAAMEDSDCYTIQEVVNEFDPTE